MMASKPQGRSNLQCFLDCITPTVETHILRKSSFRASNALCECSEMETIKYFTLSDLWGQYYEWSVYGVGTDVCLHNGQTVVQYYVPYLSGIQLYTKKVRNASRSLNGDSLMDYWNVNDECKKLSRSWSDVSEHSLINHDASWGAKKHLGHLYFEFFEVCSPYGRIPLVDMVYELAQNFPGLTSLKSVELSPASWLSVAWYPIYQIPAQHNVKELSACFLTYHHISSSFPDNLPVNVPNGYYCTTDRNGKNETQSKDKSNDTDSKRETQSEDESNIISLPPFGLASYKMQGKLWSNPENGDQKRMASLFSSADSWLKQLGVKHHDFNYFTTHPA
ncbi:uncharacterized protein [Typha angustifolia]|uniref:uncharacterized protein isoform X1 n=2 Tax=Typha angustifolia TaxID=59011 RepID=UPI003C2EB75A